MISFIRELSNPAYAADPPNPHTISLPVLHGRLEIPGFGSSPWDSFLQRVQASRKKWIILTGPDGAPHLLRNADQFLRAVFSAERVDPHDYCVRPVITTNPRATLEKTLMSAKLADNKSPERGIILFWGTEKRLIAHADLLRRLFEGVLPAPLVPEQGSA